MFLLDVLIEHRSLKLNQIYSYLSDVSVQTGIRVRVSFNNQICIAYVTKVQEYTNEMASDFSSRKVNLKHIIECIDTESLLNQELSELGKDMALTTIASLIACYQAMLPKALNVKSSHVSVPMVRYVKVKECDVKLNQSQIEILTDIRTNEYSFSLLSDKYGSKINTLYKKGCLEYYLKEKKYQSQTSVLTSGPDLSDEQSQALSHIRKSTKTMICLYGPTGSGKTEIYLQLALDAVKKGKQVLLLVPEIGLTQQMIKRVQERFENEVIVYHSHLNDTERYLQYQRVKDDPRAVVIGTRSAIFLPFSQLGLIVLDEEHDHSYKQESSVRYHTKDIAEHRALYHQCSVILGSATPSFETYARALKGVYDLVILKHRVKGQLPSVKIVKPDIRRRKIISSATVSAIQDRLDKSQQVLILLNRRGYAPVLQCIDCLETLMCPNCDRMLNVHKEDRLLKCHSCGYTSPMISVCPNCHSNQLRMLGIGTQKVEEELKSVFPLARVIRMDSDSTTRKHSHQTILESFINHEYDILLGTQMIAKGLDIPNVTLSIILDIDKSLLKSDYRSIEDAFDLIVQTAGRSGRGDSVGEVIIQSDLAEHYALRLALNHNFDAFFKTEMQYRRVAFNPPYSYLVFIQLSSRDKEYAYTKAYDLSQDLKSTTVNILGPADLGKINEVYRFRVIIKGQDLNFMRDLVREKIQSYINDGKLELSVDVNPIGGL